MSKDQTAIRHDGSSLAVYLREIGKLPRLTAAGERELGTRIQRDHDQAALSELVESNLRFVVICAKRYRGTGLPFLDLIHAGNLGLMEAARRFDPSRDVKFITYAAWWIRQSIVQGVSDQVRACSFPPKQLGSMRPAGFDLSLNEPVRPADEGRERGDLLLDDHVPPVDQEMIHQDEVERLSVALRELDAKEREVVRLRFGLEDDEPRTLQEIGIRMHLSRERVRQIEAQAKSKLRHSVTLRSHLQ